MPSSKCSVQAALRRLRVNEPSHSPVHSGSADGICFGPQSQVVDNQGSRSVRPAMPQATVIPFVRWCMPRIRALVRSVLLPSERSDPAVARRPRTDLGAPCPRRCSRRCAGPSRRPDRGWPAWEQILPGTRVRLLVQPLHPHRRTDWVILIGTYLSSFILADVTTTNLLGVDHIRVHKALSDGVPLGGVAGEGPGARGDHRDTAARCGDGDGASGGISCAPCGDDSRGRCADRVLAWRRKPGVGAVSRRRRAVRSTAGNNAANIAARSGGSHAWRCHTRCITSPTPPGASSTSSSAPAPPGDRSDIGTPEPQLRPSRHRGRGMAGCDRTRGPARL